jgi:hypothetical protein
MTVNRPASIFAGFKIMLSLALGLKDSRGSACAS